MELWLIFALVSFVFWAALSVVDKYLVSHHITYGHGYALLYGLNSIFTLGLLAFVAIDFTFSWWAGVAVVSGALYSLFLLSYISSIEKEEVSRVGLLMQLSPIFTLGAAFVFLGERLSNMETIAFVLLVVGGLFAAHKTGKEFIHKKAWLPIILSIVLLTVMSITSKFSYNNLELFTAFFWVRVGNFLSSVLIVCILWKPFKQSVKSFSPRLVSILFVILILDFLALIAQNVAIALGPISLVIATGGVLPVLIFLIAAGVSFVNPNWVKEDVAKGVLWKKLLAVVCVSVAIVLLALG